MFNVGDRVLVARCTDSGMKHLVGREAVIAGIVDQLHRRLRFDGVDGLVYFATAHLDPVEQTEKRTTEQVG